VILIIIFWKVLIIVNINDMNIVCIVDYFMKPSIFLDMFF